MSGKRLLIAGGGTGGHLFPALAVAAAWEKRFPEGEVLFVGTAQGLEARLLPGMGKRLELLQVGRIKGSGPIKRLRTLLGMPGACWAARRLIRSFAPDVVLGVGGYASVPAVIAARWLGIPTALHEQNAHPGLANRWLSRIASRVLVSFAEALPFFPGAVAQVTGNPVRAEFLSPLTDGTGEGAAPDRTAVRDEMNQSGAKAFHLLVFGGSLGAAVFAQVVPPALQQLQQHGVALKVRQQVREEEMAPLRRLYEEAGIEVELFTFCHEMVTAYREADLVICRAGATSVTELAILGKAALLVPYPFAADDHQMANAQAVMRGGGGWLVRQEEFTSEWLTRFLLERVADPASLREVGERARHLANPRAAEDIVERLITLADNNNVY